MFKLITYNSPIELYKFIKEKEIKALVVPGPDDADSVREFLPDIDVITIANFIRRYANNVEVVRKSELINLLGRLWKKTVNQSYGEFKKYYTYFTELRNNTPDLMTFSELAQTFEDPFCSYLINSYKLLDEFQIYDEFAVYKHLEINCDFNQLNEVFFLNFKFLNNAQVDFIQSLSQKLDVLLNLPELVWNERPEGTWIDWVSFDEVINLKTKFQGDLKSYLYQKEDKSSLDIKSFEQVYLNNVSSEMSLAIKSHLFFKIPNSYFVERQSLGFDWLYEQIGKSIAQVQELLQEKIKLSIKMRDHIELKVYLLMMDTFEALGLEENENLSVWDIKITQEIVTLDSPRSFLINFSEQVQVKNFHPAYLGEKKSVCFIDESPDSYTSSFSELPKETFAALNSIGFFNSSKIEEYFIKAFLENYNIQSGQLYIDSEVYEQSEWLRDLFVVQASFQAHHKINLSDPLAPYRNKKKRSRFSASSLQTFIDCPRKYHFTYDYKIRNPQLLPEILHPIDEGRLIHSLIEQNFLKKNMSEAMLRRILNDELNESKKLPSFDQLEGIENSLFKVKNGFDAVKSMIEVFGEDYEMHFEKKIQESTFTGSIDFLINNEDTLYLADFKRSKNSIPNKKEILDFKKIQLLAYLTRIDLKPKLGIGYISLSNLDDSIFIVSHKEISPKFGKVYCEDIVGILKSYQSFESELEERIENDLTFEASPIKMSECDFCEVNYLCQK